MSDDNHNTRWDNPFVQDLLGESAARRTPPALATREANNALRIAREINYYDMRLPQVGPVAVVCLTREMLDRFYCRATDRVLLDFPHQPGDNHDPGYRMTKILKPLSNALHGGPANAPGIDYDAISAICQELAEFDDTHTTGDDARFLPIAKLVSFLKNFAHRVTEGS